MATGANKNHTHGSERGGQKKKKRKAKQALQQKTKAEQSSGPAEQSRLPLGTGDLRVLILGEHDFAFAASLALAWGECSKLTATALATEAATLGIDEAEDNIETVKAFGGTIVHQVDPTALSACEALRSLTKKGFDRIAFNFPRCHPPPAPHVALEQHQELLRRCFKTVLQGKVLASGGQLHITLKPADAKHWDLVTIAKIAGLRVLWCRPFDDSEAQGYSSPCSQAVRSELPPTPPSPPFLPPRWRSGSCRFLPPTTYHLPPTSYLPTSYSLPGDVRSLGAAAKAGRGCGESSQGGRHRQGSPRAEDRTDGTDVQRGVADAPQEGAAHAKASHQAALRGQPHLSQAVLS